MTETTTPPAFVPQPARIPADQLVSDVGIAERAAEFRAAPLRGPYATLRVIQPEDYPFLRTLETSSEVATRWRLRGTTPGPEQWVQSLWNGVMVQFVVAETKTDKPIGLVALYAPNFQEGHARLGAGRFDLHSRNPVMIFGVAMFLEYVFHGWNLRKLYMDLPEYNYPQFSSGLGRFFDIEGRLREHTFASGRYWDELTLAIYRDRWQSEGARLLGTEASKFGAAADATAGGAA